MAGKIAFASLLLISVSAFAQQAGSPSPAGAPDAAPADEAGPGVARISFVSGDVSVKRGDSGEAVAAAINAPLLVADTIATGPEARAEVQFDSGHRLRLGNGVEARVAEIEHGKFRLELAHGTVSLSVLRDGGAQAEVSTPAVSFRPLQRGLYRITVGDDGQAALTVRVGQAEIYSLKGTERLNAGQTMTVRGNADDPEFQVVAALQRDEWDSWNEQRDQTLSRSESYRYVNPEIPGAEELDGQGSWVDDPAYGEVWAPRVDSDWAPYREGRWAWENYYGWTWISSDPWGWAPYHYGNWYRGSAGWCWYPGSLSRPVFWRPALVAFFGFGGGGFGVGFGGFGSVGWLPLAPFEPFHPWYGRGFRGGFDRHYLAVNNYRINNVNITNIYRNARVSGAVSGVAASSFASGRFTNITRVNSQQVRSAGLVRGPLPIAPTSNSLRFSDRATSVNPRGFTNSRFTSPARTAVARPVPFEQQRQAIQQSTQRFSTAGNVPPNRSFPAAPLAGNSAGANSAWGRFGAPSRTAAPAYPAWNTVRAGASGASSASNASTGTPGWGRFGSPNPSGVASPSAAAASSGRGFYGGRPTVRQPSSPYPASPQYGYGTANSQSLRLSPSMVHNRAYDSPSSYRQPAYSATPGYSSAPGYSAPRSSYPAPGSYSAPRSTYSAPRSYPAPGSYSAPRSTYSAPRSYSAPQTYGAPRANYSAPQSSRGSAPPHASAPPSSSPSSGGSNHGGSSHGNSSRR